MNNIILIVVFNYSDCIKNKNTIKKLYKTHFREIIFYSDFPETLDNDKEINYLKTEQGYFTHKIFHHFYLNYRNLIEQSDGIFYTMDDNIININILNLYNKNKIIFYTPKPKTEIEGVNNIKYYSWFSLKHIDDHKDWWWDILPNGLPSRENIKKIMNNEYIKKCNINKFSGSFSDFFYLPKKYLNEKLFTLFKLFSEYKIFLEIAVPTIIHNIEPDESNYQPFSNKVFWGRKRKYLAEKQNIYNSLNQSHDLIIHPIKLKDNPDLKHYLVDILCKKKCVIITTINKPTITILKHINNKDYDVIIVGDKKTPNNYKSLNCIFLDIESQQKLFPKLHNILPYNHYCRKNLGYLYAIKKKYEIIYETDDDNIPYDEFDNILNQTNSYMIRETESKWINIFKYFTYNSHIWPRGYPLTLIKNEPSFEKNNCDKIPSIINGLVENDPDVDSLFRLICNQKEIKWSKNKSIIIDNQNICVFNTQNTFWVDKNLFISMFIPCHVSFRYCDILRGIITNIILNKTDKYMMYTSPNVIQKRNEHNLIEDFKSEYDMYINNENILEYLENSLTNNLNYIYLIQTAGSLPQIYSKFRNNKKYVILSYKINTEDTDIFFPNSTWTTGRNKLREYCLNLPEKYDYYIFLDDDIVFLNNLLFDNFEDYLNKYRPFIGNPKLLHYPEYNNLKNNITTTIWFDGICNAFSREALNCNIIFPYIDIFDKENWWMSQYIMIILCSLYKKEVIVFNDIIIDNKNHSEYPKKNVWKKVENFVLNNNNDIFDKNWNHTNFVEKKLSIKYIKDLIKKIYDNLLNNNVIKKTEIDLLNIWLSYFDS